MANMDILLPSLHLDLYNTLHYNMVITLITVGPQLVILDYFCFVYTFYSGYNMACIANMEIGLDPNSSVIKRLWCNYE